MASNGGEFLGGPEGPQTPDLDAFATMMADLGMEEASLEGVLAEVTSSDTGVETNTEKSTEITLLDTTREQLKTLDAELSALGEIFDPELFEKTKAEITKKADSMWPWLGQRVFISGPGVISYAKYTEQEEVPVEEGEEPDMNGKYEGPGFFKTPLDDQVGISEGLVVVPDEDGYKFMHQVCLAPVNTIDKQGVEVVATIRWAVMDLDSSTVEAASLTGVADSELLAQRYPDLFKAVTDATQEGTLNDKVTAITDVDLSVVKNMRVSDRAELIRYLRARVGFKEDVPYIFDYASTAKESPVEEFEPEDELLERVESGSDRRRIVAEDVGRFALNLATGFGEGDADEVSLALEVSEIDEHGASRESRVLLDGVVRVRSIFDILNQQG